jgi:hypothetical protein
MALHRLHFFKTREETPERTEMSENEGSKNVKKCRPKMSENESAKNVQKC